MVNMVLGMGICSTVPWIHILLVSCYWAIQIWGWHLRHDRHQPWATRQCQGANETSIRIPKFLHPESFSQRVYPLKKWWERKLYPASYWVWVDFQGRTITLRECKRCFHWFDGNVLLRKSAIFFSEVVSSYHWIRRSLVTFTYWMLGNEENFSGQTWSILRIFRVQSWELPSIIPNSGLKVVLSIEDIMTIYQTPLQKHWKNNISLV